MRRRFKPKNEISGLFYVKYRAFVGFGLFFLYFQGTLTRVLSHPSPRHSTFLALYKGEVCSFGIRANSFDSSLRFSFSKTAEAPSACTIFDLERYMLIVRTQKRDITAFILRNIFSAFCSCLLGFNGNLEPSC